MSNTPPAWARTVGLTMYEAPLIDHVGSTEPNWDMEKVFTVSKTDKAQEKGYVVAGLSLPVDRSYSEPIQSEDMKELEDWTQNVVELAMGVDWDMRLIEDSVHIKDLFGTAATEVAESFAQAKGIRAAVVLNRAFNSTTQPLYDTSALCDSVTSDWAVTVDNDLPVATPSYDSIWDMAKFIMNDQRTLKDKKKKGVPVTYVHHPTWIEEVMWAFGNKFVPGTITRDENMFKKKFNVETVECIDLTDENAHFMFGKRAKKNFRFKMNKDVTTVWDDHPRNRTRSALSHMKIFYYVINRDDVVGIPGS